MLSSCSLRTSTIRQSTRGNALEVALAECRLTGRLTGRLPNASTHSGVESEGLASLRQCRRRHVKDRLWGDNLKFVVSARPHSTSNHPLRHHVPSCLGVSRRCASKPIDYLTKSHPP